MKVLPRDIEATVTFLRSDDAGKTKHVVSGYRAQFHYQGSDWDAVHEYPDTAVVNPGDTARVYLAFLSPAEHWGRIAVGMPFLIREGHRIVAYGAVTRILQLEESALRSQSP